MSVCVQVQSPYLTTALPTSCHHKEERPTANTWILTRTHISWLQRGVNTTAHVAKQPPWNASSRPVGMNSKQERHRANWKIKKKYKLTVKQSHIMQYHKPRVERLRVHFILFTPKKKIKNATHFVKLRLARGKFCSQSGNKERSVRAGVALHYWPTCAPNHALQKAGRLSVIHLAELLSRLRRHASTALYCLDWSLVTATLMPPHNTCNMPTSCDWCVCVNKDYTHTKTQWPTHAAPFHTPARDIFLQFQIKLSETVLNSLMYINPLPIYNWWPEPTHGDEAGRINFLHHTPPQRHLHSINSYT